VTIANSGDDTTYREVDRINSSVWFEFSTHPSAIKAKETEQLDGTKNFGLS
jgi:hypothetical protein